MDSLPPLLIKTRRRRRRRQIWQKPQTRRHHPRQKKSPKKSNFGGLCHPFFAATFYPSFFLVFQKTPPRFPPHPGSGWFFHGRENFSKTSSLEIRGCQKRRGRGKRKILLAATFQFGFFPSPSSPEKIAGLQIFSFLVVSPPPLIFRPSIIFPRKTGPKRKKTFQNFLPRDVTRFKLTSGPIEEVTQFR